MKITILFGATGLLMGSFLAVQAGPADDVKSAAQKLNDESSYSWHTTTVVPESARFKPGPMNGKIEKDGLTYIKMTFGDNTTEVYMNGTNAVLTDPDDGGWQKLSEMDTSQGPGRMMGGMVRNFKSPATQAADLVANCSDLQMTNGAYASALTEAGAKQLMIDRKSVV